MITRLASRSLAAAICSALLASAPCTAQADGTWTFKLPAQSLADALRAVGGRASTNVFFEPRLVADYQAPALDGELTVGQALGQLLRGTGLTFRYLDDNTITIVQQQAGSGGSSGPATVPASATSLNQSFGRFRLAQADESATSETRGAAHREEEEIVVTGSRLGRSSVEGAVPVQVYDRERIERSGQTTVTDFLNTLPQVSVSTPENSGVYAGQTTIQLRGLPKGTTLVLINGRRLQNGGATAYYGGYFDLNNIPAAAVERIEIVPQGSSAIYGSDALAGVVNIILKKDFDGVQANAHYGGGSGIDDKSLDFALGQSWDRASFSLIGSYYERSELANSERYVTGNDALGVRTDRCSPGTVTSTNGGALPGLSSSFAAISPGVSGEPTLADFTAGTRADCRLYADGNVIPPAERASVFASGTLRLASNVELFAELMYSHSEQTTWYYYPTQINRRVPASNAFNPFGVDVLVSNKLVSPGTKRVYDGEAEFVRPLLGVRGEFGRSWHWEAAAWESRDKSNYTQAGNYLDSVALTQALASAEPTTALNMFSDSNPGSVALLRSIYQDDHTENRGEAQVVNAFVKGSLFDLPGGAVEMAFGGEYTSNELIWLNDRNAQSNFRYDRDTKSVFAEVRVPLIGSKRPLAGDVMALTAAARYDDYSDFGSNVTPQYALEWRPFDTLLLRASYAEAFKAPGLVQVYGPLRLYQGNCCVIDPLNGGASVSFDDISGGNPDLQPELGESRALGFVWSPTAIDGLTTSVTYWELQQSNRATQLSTPQTFVDYPDLFPGRVIRDPVTNQIQTIDLSFLNFGEVNVEGLDVDVSYRWRTRAGDFVPAVALAEIFEYRSELVPGAPARDRLGHADETEAWAPRRKGSVSLGWSMGSYSANANARYVSSYTDYQYLGPTTRQLGDFWMFDLAARYELDLAHRFIENAFVQLSVVNLANSLPRWSAFNAGSKGYDPTQYDIRGRFVSLNFGFKL
ncbi:TonB-dependent receptor [Peristeroidobacter soli]|uniref:TonB-dependent receptor n=1 Tax=Peristeroidobacter soli TaxID=2497877 RepID=UPI00101B8ED1|nr:TonB-dependent receptor [Peristeroidobacter soli]